MKDNAFVEVLKIASFRNLWLSQAISQISINLLVFTLMIRVYETTHSNSAVSLLVLFYTIPNIALGALAGVLVDRWGRKKVMFLSHFIRVFAVLLFLVSSETLGWLYSLILLISVITQFFFPAEAATIPQLVKDKKLLLTANGLFSVTFFGSVVVGNVLAGPSLQLLGPQTTFFLVSLAFLVASAFTARIPKDENGVSYHPTLDNLVSDFLFGLNHLYHSSKVRKGIFVLGASQISIGIMGTIAPGFADKILKVAPADVSLLVMAPAAAGMVLGAVTLGQCFREVNRQTLIRTGFLLGAVTLIIYSLIDKITAFLPLPTVLASFFVLMVLGAANAFLDIPVNTIIQENTPEEIRSRVYGVVSTVIGLTGIFPIILSGALADIIGVRLVMLSCGVVLLGAAWRYVTDS